MPALESTVPPNVAQPVVNLSGYRFVTLDYLPVLQHDMLAELQRIGVKGTVLLAGEGINVALSGSREQTRQVRRWFDQDPRLCHLWLKESESGSQPFSRLKVRMRHEIITFQPDDTRPRLPSPRPQAPTMAPATLQRWLDEARDFTLLDTRNHYEIESGTFAGAQHLIIAHFREFTVAVEAALERGELDTERPMVTFCTGGIRCEKAAPWLQQRGFKEVYQVEGGVLNYFDVCAGAHWQGNCFVFDDRVEIDTSLSPTGSRLCKHCHRAVSQNQDCGCDSGQADITQSAHISRA